MRQAYVDAGVFDDLPDGATRSRLPLRSSNTMKDRKSVVPGLIRYLQKILQAERSINWPRRPSSFVDAPVVDLSVAPGAAPAPAGDLGGSSAAAAAAAAAPADDGTLYNTDEED